MKQATFEERYGAQWARLEEWLDGNEKLRKAKRDRASAVADAEIPFLYRRICQLLALARDRQYSPDLVDRLNRLALRGHHLLYGARGGQSVRVLAFLAADFPRLVREEWRLVVTAGLLFAGPLALLFAVVLLFPAFIHYLVDPAQLAAFQEMYNPANPRLGLREGDDNTLMFAFYIWNNVKIGFQVFYLLYNGLLIGAIAGHITGIGYGEPFWSFVSGHSAMELTAIVIAGAAGLKLGGALIAPGARTRAAALVQAAKPAVRLVYGAALMFMIAAFIEGFWSPLTVFPPQTKYTVGMTMWGFVFAYFVFAGRRRGA
jgi:uncharacterized membrane protein SpoIIM required for sporulation